MVTILKNLKINIDVHKRLKMAALEDDLPLREYTEAAIELALDNRNKLRKQVEAKLKQDQNGGS